MRRSRRSTSNESSRTRYVPPASTVVGSLTDQILMTLQDKCLEAVRELNASIEVSFRHALSVLSRPNSPLAFVQAIFKSNMDVEITSELFDNYRRNAEWNLKHGQLGMPAPVMLEAELPQASQGSSPAPSKDV